MGRIPFEPKSIMSTPVQHFIYDERDRPFKNFVPSFDSPTGLAALPIEYRRAYKWNSPPLPLTVFERATKAVDEAEAEYCAESKLEVRYDYTRLHI